MSRKLLSDGSEKVENTALPWSTILLVLLAALFVILRFWNIAAYSVWGGEAFTIIGSVKSWGDMFAYIVADIVHPPLIYVLLKLWLAAGDSTLWLKLFPVLSGTAVIIPFYLLCRELDFQLPEINLALLMLAVNGYLVHYAQELRMYSLFMFLAACSYWLFIRWFKAEEPAKGQLLLLTLINLLAIYTHYYGWVVVGMEFLFLLLWRRQKVVAFTLSTIFLLLAFAPWAYLVVREAMSIGGLEKNLDWIPKPGTTDILNLYTTFNGPLGNRYVKLFGLALFGLPLLLWGWRLLRAGFNERRNEWIRFSWLAPLAFVPVLALFIVSQFMDQAVWMDRYFIFIAIPYMMLVATAVYQLNPRWLRYGWTAAIVAWALLAGFNDWHTNRMAWESPQLGSRLNWDEMVAQMVAANAVANAAVNGAESDEPVTIYTLTLFSRGYRTGDWALSTSIAYFLDQQNEDGFQIRYARDVYVVLEEAEQDYFWVAFFELEEWPQPSPALILAEHGFRVGEEIAFENGPNRVAFVPVWRE